MTANLPAPMPSGDPTEHSPATAVEPWRHVPPAPTMTAPAGWYPSPSFGGHMQWWDGQRWGPVQAPANPVVVVVAPKSVGLAFLLTFFFGPFGLLYATVTGGLVMIGVSFVAFFLSLAMFGIPSLLAWIGCMVWGCVAANEHNDQLVRINSTLVRY